MPELVRCPACRSVASVTVLWAIGDTCPRCSARLCPQAHRGVSRRRMPDRVLHTVVASGRAAGSVVPPSRA